MAAKGLAGWRIPLKEEPADDCASSVDEGDDPIEGDLDSEEVSLKEEPFVVPAQFITKETPYSSSQGLLAFLAKKRGRPSIDEAINLDPNASDADKFYRRAEYVTRLAREEREEAAVKDREGAATKDREGAASNKDRKGAATTKGGP